MLCLLHVLIGRAEFATFARSLLDYTSGITYEDVAKRQLSSLILTEQEVNDILDYICRIAIYRQIFYLWRPVLKDAKDDMVLEVAVAAACDYIVTFNVRDFVGSEQFGVQVVPPKVFLQQIGVLP